MLVAVIVTMITKNQSNRSVPAANLPLNATKQMLLNLVSDAQMLVSKLAGLFYNVTGESIISMLSIIALVALVLMAVYHSLK